MEDQTQITMYGLTVKLEVIQETLIVRSGVL